MTTPNWHCSLLYHLLQCALKSTRVRFPNGTSILSVGFAPVTDRLADTSRYGIIVRKGRIMHVVTPGLLQGWHVARHLARFEGIGPRKLKDRSTWKLTQVTHYIRTLTPPQIGWVAVARHMREIQFRFPVKLFFEFMNSSASHTVAYSFSLCGPEHVFLARIDE